MDFLDELSQYSKKQIDFLLAMLETGNISKSAKRAQITETTAFKYLKDGLKEKLEEIRKKYLEANFLNFKPETTGYAIKIDKKSINKNNVNNEEV